MTQSDNVESMINVRHKRKNDTRMTILSTSYFCQLDLLFSIVIGTFSSFIYKPQTNFSLGVNATSLLDVRVYGGRFSIYI